MNISVEVIKKATAEFYGIEPSDINGPWRKQEIVQPRHVAMYLSRHLTNLSFPDLGTEFGGRNHTTIMHAVRKIKKRMERELNLLNEIDTIAAAIGCAVEPESERRMDRLVNALAPLIAERMAEIAPTKTTKPKPIAQVTLPVRIKLVSSHRKQRAVDGVISAYQKFESDRFSYNEPASLRLLEKACVSLRKAHQLKPISEQRQKETS